MKQKRNIMFQPKQNVKNSRET